jgi:hypothetical protein
MKSVVICYYNNRKLIKRCSCLKLHFGGTGGRVGEKISFFLSCFHKECDAIVQVSPKGPYVKGLMPRVVVLGGGGTFWRWGLVEGS